MRISDWSSDVCSSDLLSMGSGALPAQLFSSASHDRKQAISALVNFFVTHVTLVEQPGLAHPLLRWNATLPPEVRALCDFLVDRSEERRVGKECVSTGRSRGSPAH